MTGSPASAGRGVDRAAISARVRAAQLDTTIVLVPPFPDIVAHTQVAAPLLPVRAANALNRVGIQTFKQIVGWSFVDFLVDGMGIASIEETTYILEVLASLSPSRLTRLSAAQPAVVPNLPIEVLIALANAKSIDDEVVGLLADLDQRNTDLILARWGFGAGGPRILEEVGAEFGITRERARQIVTAKEKQIVNSGVRLPLATDAVNDLDEAGGVLPDAHYEILLRYSFVTASSSAVAVLPCLSDLGVVPEVRFDETARLWVTSNGECRVDGAAEVREGIVAARRRVARYLRRLGAVPVELLDELSPFGRGHALSLLEQNGVQFTLLVDYALRIPIRDSALLRQCRKTLVATRELQLDELLRGIRANGFSVSPELLETVLDRSDDFVITGDRVHLAQDVIRTGILSGAEAQALTILQQSGGVTSWWEFIDAMKAAGFSAPMASVVLKKAWIRRLGPGLYGLRGRAHDPAVIRGLNGTRRRAMRRRVIRKTVRTEAGKVRTSYTLNRFALQGVLPAPAAIKEHPGAWTARLPDNRTIRIKVSKGFMWPFQTFMQRFQLKPGDGLEMAFNPMARTVDIEVTSRSADRGVGKPISREQQVLRALFGSDI